MKMDVVHQLSSASAQRVFGRERVLGSIVIASIKKQPKRTRKKERLVQARSSTERKHWRCDAFINFYDRCLIKFTMIQNASRGKVHGR